MRSPPRQLRAYADSRFANGTDLAGGEVYLPACLSVHALLYPEEFDHRYVLIIGRGLSLPADYLPVRAYPVIEVVGDGLGYCEPRGFSSCFADEVEQFRIFAQVLLRIGVDHLSLRRLG